MPTFQISGGNISARVTYTTESSISENRSTVRITRVEIRSNENVYESCWLTGKITVNGSAAAELTLSSLAGCGVILSGSWAGGGSNWSGWAGTAVRVNHKADGTCTHIPVSVSLSVTTTAGVYRGGVSATQYIDLPAIPRASGVSVTPAALGQKVQIRISAVTSGVTETLTWACGTEQGTIGQGLTGTVEWTPPLTLAAQAPAADSVEIHLTVTSFLSGKQLGSSKTSFRCPIPESVVPSLAVTVTEQMGHREKYGGFVRGKTQIRVQTTAAGAYGSTIAQTDVRFGGLTAQGTDAAFLPPDGGSVKLTVTVTDSRDRKASVSQTVQVLSYTEPAASVENLYRCSADGSELPDGGYGAVIFSGSATQLGANTVRWYLEYRQRGSEGWSRTEMTEYQGVFLPQSAAFVFPAGVDRAFEIRIVCEDDFACRTSGTALLPVAFAMLDLCRESKAVGIGQRANNAGMLSVGMDMKLSGHRITDLGKAKMPTDAVSFNDVYPVGSIFLSVAETSPAALFGGTWERIKDRFLLAAGDGYAAGDMGGSADAVVVSHSHYTSTAGEYFVTSEQSAASNQRITPSSSGTRYVDAQTVSHAHHRTATAASGESGAGKNMPPYLVVYIWKRTA